MNSLVLSFLPTAVPGAGAILDGGGTADKPVRPEGYPNHRSTRAAPGRKRARSLAMMGRFV
jgi:hypothetical protein